MDIGKLIKQAQEMQNNVAKAQEILSQTEVEGKAGGDAITIKMTAKGKAKSLHIAPSLLKESEQEIIEDLMIAAINDAQSKIEKITDEVMKEATAGMPLPPGMKLPF